MSKIIPKFHLPKEYPEDMKLFTESLVHNNGQTLKAVVNSLFGKIMSHTGKTKGKSKSKTTIKNYLTGFYVLDLFSSDNLFYSDTAPSEKVSISINSVISVTPTLKDCLHSSSIDSFNEKFTDLCTEKSLLIRKYNSDRNFLKEKHNLPENPSRSLIQQMLVKHCDYSYVGIPGVEYLDRFYQDKIQIDSYLKLMSFILQNYGELAKKRLGLIPIANILDHIKKISNYTDEEFKQHLLQLQLTHRIELRTTKSQLARNMGIDLVNIRGVQYGFMKILEPSILV
ncbi:hypothetical protein IQ215_07810 [Cyanobacterium stanieri LEGE 03274]|uniref:Transposase n=1 Tax=Cyanobacterium stanieri LEGE 03274 TaxID=1828756 RepID=A0ABR9V4Z4_9CHRO|nr:hypothetical protein [Cyanobacterium stanieri]MBE9222601.1 hypothetical protein [Cyanobacterium stanieri LEGE 03274]